MVLLLLLFPKPIPGLKESDAALTGVLVMRGELAVPELVRLLHVSLVTETSEPLLDLLSPGLVVWTFP